MLERTDQPRSTGQRPPAVRAAGSVPRQLLLPMLPGDGGEPGADAAVGPAAFGSSGLWQSQADRAAAPGRLDPQSQAGGAAAAVDGDRGDLRQAEVEPARVWTSDLPVSVKGFGSDGTGSGLVFRHYVCAYGDWVYVFGGGDGLVEPVRAGVAIEQHAGGGLLCGRLGGGVAGGASGAVDLQHRPGVAVHLSDIHRRGGIGGGGREYGRTGPLDGQPVYREAVEERQV